MNLAKCSENMPWMRARDDSVLANENVTCSHDEHRRFNTGSASSDKITRWGFFILQVFHRFRTEIRMSTAESGNTFPIRLSAGAYQGPSAQGAHSDQGETGECRPQPARKDDWPPVLQSGKAGFGPTSRRHQPTRAQSQRLHSHNSSDRRVALDLATSRRCRLSTGLRVFAVISVTDRQVGAHLFLRKWLCCSVSRSVGCSLPEEAACCLRTDCGTKNGIAALIRTRRFCQRAFAYLTTTTVHALFG
jgi:hypothetical protein